MFPFNGYNALPLDPSLVAWYDASRINGVNTANPSNGSAVSRWADLSGFGNHAIQTTLARQPVFTTNVINGLPGVLGSKASLTYLAASGPSLEITPSITCFAVYICTNISDGALQGVFYKNSGGGLGSGPYGLLTGSSGMTYRMTSSSNTPYGLSSNPSVTNNVPYIVEFNVSPDVSNAPTLTYNTSSVLTGPSLNSNLGTNNSVLYLMGQIVGNDRSLTGYLMEVLIYRRYLPPSEQLSVKQYLGTKYNVAVS